MNAIRPQQERVWTYRPAISFWTKEVMPNAWEILEDGKRYGLSQFVPEDIAVKRCQYVAKLYGGTYGGRNDNAL